MSDGRAIVKVKNGWGGRRPGAKVLNESEIPHPKMPTTINEDTLAAYSQQVADYQRHREEKLDARR